MMMMVYEMMMTVYKMLVLVLNMMMILINDDDIKNDYDKYHTVIDNESN
jgi:hypothetical protein